MIPFNKPFMTGQELAYIAQAHANGHLAGNGAVLEAVLRLARGRGSAARRRCSPTRARRPSRWRRS